MCCNWWKWQRCNVFVYTDGLDVTKNVSSVINSDVDHCQFWTVISCGLPLYIHCTFTGAFSQNVIFVILWNSSLYYNIPSSCGKSSTALYNSCQEYICCTNWGNIVVTFLVWNLSVILYHCSVSTGWHVCVCVNVLLWYFLQKWLQHGGALGCGRPSKCSQPCGMSTAVCSKSCSIPACIC